MPSSRQIIHFVKVQIASYKILELPRRTDEWLSHLQFNLPKCALNTSREEARTSMKWKGKWLSHDIERTCVCLALICAFLFCFEGKKFVGLT